MGGEIRAVLAGTVLAVAGTLTFASPALAAFPGANGKIAFGNGASVPPFDNDILTIGPTGGDPTPLTSGPARDFQPAYSADGERIAWMRNAPASNDYSVWVMSSDGSGQTQVPGAQDLNERDPSWFPDNERLAITQGVLGNPHQIVVVNADGSNPVQLTFAGPNGDDTDAPAVSPDGQKIAYERVEGATGLRQIWVMNADGSGQTPLTFPASPDIEDGQPDWSPDGRRIVFSRYDDGPGESDLFVIDADGSNPTRITSGPEDDQSPAFSPDGTQVVFSRQDNSGPSFSNLFVTSPDGLNSQSSPLTSNSAPAFSFEPNWQPLNPPACDLSGKAKQKSVKRVSVTVTCQNENATVVADGSGSAPKVPKAGAVASKKRKKKFTIPAVTSQVPRATPTTVTLKIPKKGAKALKKAQKAGEKGKATITATLTDDLGQSSTKTFRVTFKPKKKKK